MNRRLILIGLGVLVLALAVVAPMMVPSRKPTAPPVVEIVPVEAAPKPVEKRFVLQRPSTTEPAVRLQILAAELDRPLAARMGLVQGPIVHALIMRCLMVHLGPEDPALEVALQTRTGPEGLLEFEASTTNPLPADVESCLSERVWQAPWVPMPAAVEVTHHFTFRLDPPNPPMARDDYDQHLAEAMNAAQAVLEMPEAAFAQ